ncbi:MAG TPA: DinB family protein [Phycisphaerales bacterium]|nr:DinB family protein [Phycisphaerales bacterium]
MLDLGTIRTLIEYTDWSNTRLLEGAAPLGDEQLDRDVQIGPGTLRRIMLHIYNGEHIWLRRWQGIVENAWPDEGARVSIGELRASFAAHVAERGRWIEGLAPDALGRVQKYRDSKGTLYQATLGDMMVQGVMHSKHHQAQAVNAIRRLGGEWPELDYMYRVRKPA